MQYQEQKLYTGNPRQLFSVRESRLLGGKMDGVRVADIHNGGNLEVCVAVDRCMDIPEIRYRGRVLNYITPNGIVHPSYYNCFGEGWSEAFAGGLLYTCGLSNTGLREDTDWLTQKEHGCIANTPAEQFAVRITESGDGPAAELSGVMREGMLAGIRLKMVRTIRVSYLRDEIEVVDMVSNEGFRTAPHMILYHCNLGYPLLQPDSAFFIPNRGVRARTPFAGTHLPELNTILPPQDELEEMCYYYMPAPDESGWEQVRLENRREHIGLTLSFDTATLPHFVQWKNFVKGEYVMGLEPANCTIDGRSDALARGQMQFLEPGQSATYRLKFHFDDTKE